MQSLFITATGTNVGKTHTTLQLIEVLSDQGYKVGVFKPIETGVVHDAPDASLLLKACQKVNENFKTLKVEDITAYTFLCPQHLFVQTRSRRSILNLSWTNMKHFQNSVIFFW